MLQCLQSSPTCGLGGDVVSRVSRWPSWQPFWILELNNYSNSESLCPSNASHQVSAQSDLWFGRSMAAIWDDLGYRNGTILAILNLYVATMHPTKFQLNPTYGSGGDVENVKS